MIEGLVLGLHLISQHMPSLEEQNNQNFGLYFRTKENWGGGIYRNTLNRTSVYFGKMWSYEIFSFSVGAITGYQKKIESVPCEQMPARFNAYNHSNCRLEIGFSRGAISLMAAPSISIGFVRLSYIPKVKESSSVLHLSVEKEL